MKLIIVEGSTSTGKSTLAQRLSEDLEVPVFKKDSYKERQFDKIGENLTIFQMKRIEKQSWVEVFKAAEDAIKADRSLIVEANFRRSHRRQFSKLIKGDVVVIELFCYAHGLTILKRYIGRNRSGKRHPGHRDQWWYFIVALQAPFTFFLNKWRPLRLTGNLLKIKTDNFNSINYKSVEKFIHETK